MDSEISYKDIIDDAHDLIYTVRLDGTLLYVNKSWLKTLEYSPEEIQHMSIFQVLDESDRDQFIEYRKQVIKGIYEQKEIIINFRTKSGKKVIAEGFVTVKLNHGKPAYTCGIFRDITGRVKNENQLQIFTEQLKEREYNLQQLINHAPDSIIVIDRDSRILLWNKKAEEIFGWSANEVIGTGLANSIIPPMYREAHTKGMQRYLSTGEAHVMNKSIEVPALNKKGEEFYISLTISTTRQNNEIAFIAFIRDITVQRNNELELERKKKELEQSHREVEQYSWLTSHDLKEPLRKIITYSDLILTQNKVEVPDQIHKYAVKICESGRRMTGLIDSILTYSNLTSERHHFSQTDLNEVLKGVISDLELLIKENNAVVIGGHLPTIEAAPLQMRQLFQNLISNSIKYKRKEVQPFVEITADETNAGIIQLFFKDNGIGLEQEHHEKIFRLFQRIKTSAKLEGSGIGLAICKKIVERHRGAIKVESIPQMGTVFIITLPRKYD